MAATKDDPAKKVRGRKRARPLLFRLTAVLISCCVAIVGFEVVLRVTRDSGRFYPYYPNAVKVMYPDEEITPGVSGASYFSTNRFGCRGPDPAGEKHRLLVVGGSTAACTPLDDTEAWPHLVMQRVNSHFGDARLWVTNSGIDGKTSRHHVMHARHLVPKIPDLDHVLVYCGLNDLGHWLLSADFDPNYLDKQENVEHITGSAFRFSNYTPSDSPWYKHLELWKRVAVLKANIRTKRLSAQRDSGVIVQDDRMEWLKSARERRRLSMRTKLSEAKLATLPSALDEYARNLVTIADTVRGHGSEPIFMAQATSYTGLSPEEQERLWMGAVSGGDAFLEADELAAFVVKYNERMRKVAEEKGVLFVDLPASLTGENLFYDGCHLNEAGAAAVADVVADVLVKELYGR